MKFIIVFAIFTLILSCKNQQHQYRKQLPIISEKKIYYIDQCDNNYCLAISKNEEKYYEKTDSYKDIKEGSKIVIKDEKIEVKNDKKLKKQIKNMINKLSKGEKIDSI